MFSLRMLSLTQLTAIANAVRYNQQVFFTLSGKRYQYFLLTIFVNFLLTVYPAKPKSRSHGTDLVCIAF